mgnify:CR=1 FL=1
MWPENARTKYQFQLDESFRYALKENRELHRRWFEYIPCRNGKIYIYSETRKLFALYTTSILNANRIIQEVERCHIDRIDGEAVILFPIEALDQVAKLAKAKRRRRLSLEAKAKLIEKGKAYRFSSRGDGAKVRKMDPDLTEKTKAIGK